ncbi:hypothetical protein C3F09_02040 [candidate division GN15 bacterium]|uniref:DUF4340 domain-containing protein n=1 Tax=candidate division GN15 bacterium TaxID=2072418 RepID=A0A855XBU0_9BACT|nr:MAG: hypothetical protein C3F09_02040 [candidate division GN15 bacterium]
MNDSKKTLIYVGVAAVLALLAFVTSPRKITPEAFSDQGKPFFPDFKDPNAATTLEVVSFDEAAGTASPFKVTFKDNRWIIPSHNNYPADAKDRLAKTAAGVMDIKRDDFRSDNVADYPKFGVVDPTDPSTSGLTGRGTRVTLKGSGDQVLADFIVGKPVGGSDGYRFVRVPGEKRVYAAKMNVDLSARFEDWVEKDLLKVTRSQIAKVGLRYYSIDERTGRVNQGENVVLSQRDGKWVMGGGQPVDSAAVQKLLAAIDDLKLVGVRPKPKGLAAVLAGTGQNMIQQQDLLSLQSKGFYISPQGQLLSNEGEMQVYTTYGVVYTLRFGEVAYGAGEALTAGTGEDQAAKTGAAANRYIFVTVAFDPSVTSEPKRPANSSWQGKPDSTMTDADRENKRLQEEHDRWERNVQTGRSQADELNRRFADWYYVISSASFDQLHVKRSDLLPKKS